jgi:hypothetical protein
MRAVKAKRRTETLDVIESLCNRVSDRRFAGSRRPDQKEYPALIASFIDDPVTNFLQDPLPCSWKTDLLSIESSTLSVRYVIEINLRCLGDHEIKTHDVEAENTHQDFARRP